MEFWLHYAQPAQSLIRSGYVLVLLVLVFSFLEVVIPPIPGDTVLVLGSSLAAAAGIAPLWLIIGASTGTFLASLVCYRLGKRLGERLLESPRLARLLDTRMFLKLKKWFARYGYWTLLASRFLPVARSGVVLAAGILKFETKRTFSALGFSIVLSSTLFVTGGYLLGQRRQELYRLWQARYHAVLLIGGALLLLVGLVKLLLKNQDQSK